ncbi:MAG: hypothetical protein NBKEAIPA_00393 [Nitrospirae bacterium]|nr:MAG: hypothetical protein UZ03_NOB001003469 [Nitrospira sp. OLB3]MBV6468527.1 hypothetical protein [Nitrospirota bacterium]MCE7965243.1 hypothetical protein [Nitrospira sp. NTP2]RIK58609.1 MAG: hypothetical protein DCC63_10295 [Nitrospira sp.]
MIASRAIADAGKVRLVGCLTFPQAALSAILTLLLAAQTGCTSSLQDESVTVDPAKSGQRPEVRFVTIVPNPPTLAAPIGAHVVVNSRSDASLVKHFQWIVNGTPLLGATDYELKQQYLKRGDSIAVEVVVADGELESLPYRTEPVVVTNTPPLVTSVTIEADPALPASGLLAKVDVVDPDRDDLHYLYRWLRNGKLVQEGEENRLDTAGFSRKDTVAVEVIIRDEEVATLPVRAAPIVLGNSPPRITSTPAAVGGREVYEYVVQADDPERDAITFVLETAPPGMTIDRNSGRISWRLIPGPAGTHRVKVLADDGQGGMAWQEFELTIPSASDLAVAPTSRG